MFVWFSRGYNQSQSTHSEDYECSPSEDRCGEVRWHENFGIWRCEVIDVLTASKLKDDLLLENKPKEISEKDWEKMNWTTCGIIRSFFYRRSELSYDDQDFWKENLGDPKGKYLTKSIKNHLHLKMKLLFS